MEDIVSQLTWANSLIILELVILEGLLSFDNALALAALVKGRLTDPKDQKLALLWGIWGAYIMRTGVVFIGVWLMEYEWAKAIAGGYLVWLAASELFFKKELENETAEVSFIDPNSDVYKSHRLKRLWKTILAVELMDFMFSIDSIGVALAISNVKWVLVTGALLGILMMRIAAGAFIKLIDSFPILEKTAFVLVGLAGVNVLLKLKNLPLGFAHLTIDKEIPEAVFLPLLLFVLIGAMVLNKMFPEKFGHKAVESGAE